jgi:hypothetical protein
VFRSRFILRCFHQRQPNLTVVQPAQQIVDLPRLGYGSKPRDHNKTGKILTRSIIACFNVVDNVIKLICTITVLPFHFSYRTTFASANGGALAPGRGGVTLLASSARAGIALSRNSSSRCRCSSAACTQ